MNFLRSILTGLAIASLLMSDAVVAVHSAGCSQATSSASFSDSSGDAKQPRHCCGHQHCAQQSQAAAGGTSQDHSSDPVAPTHDCDQCTICRGALVCRFAVVCDAVLPPAFEGLEDWVTVDAATLSLGQEFTSAFSERGPPA
jgi:hypothetical protein